MRKFTLPHTAKWVAVCLGFVVGSLIFQGCGDDSASKANDPYAALDARFPNGRVAVVDVATRTQDKEYMAKISEGASKISALSSEVQKYEARLAHIRNEVRKSVTLKTGADVPETLLDDELATVPLYQETVALHAAAVAAVEAQRLENANLIRARMSADAEAYDAMLAEADAKAREMGLPTRHDTEPETVQPKAPAGLMTEKSRPATPAVTVEDLARQTGIPLAPQTEPAGK